MLQGLLSLQIPWSCLLSTPVQACKPILLLPNNDVKNALFRTAANCRLAGPHCRAANTPMPFWQSLIRQENANSLIIR